MTGGSEFTSSVFPLILRNVALLGVDSVGTALERRRSVWQRLATDLRPRGLDEAITREIDLDAVDPFLDEVLAGRGRGRTVVRVAGWGARHSGILNPCAAHSSRSACRAPAGFSGSAWKATRPRRRSSIPTVGTSSAKRASQRTTARS